VSSTTDMVVLQPMSWADARDLTATLREHLAISGALLLEAYERQAWRAMGYGSWREYVNRELAVALTSVQRRLDHTRLVRALIQMGVTPDEIPSVPLASAGRALQALPIISEADQPIEALVGVLTAIRERRDESAATTDQIDHTLHRLLGSIERAALRVGLTPEAFLERAIVAATQVVGCD